MIFGAVVARDLDRWSERLGVTITESDVEPSNWFLAQIGRATSASNLIAAIETIQRWSRDAPAVVGGRLRRVGHPDTADAAATPRC